MDCDVREGGRKGSENRQGGTAKRIALEVATATFESCMDNMGGSMVPGNEIPPHHPIRELFLTLTDRGLRESHLSDEEIHLNR